VAHNIAKFEEHEVDGVPRRLCVHRKGATRAFGPGRAEVPIRYRALGQRDRAGGHGDGVLGAAGDAGGDGADVGSTCHGAGRQMSRHAALKLQQGHEVARKLEDRGIVVRAAGKKTLAEEAPEAYKSVDAVVETCVQAGNLGEGGRLRPLAVMKG